MRLLIFVLFQAMDLFDMSKDHESLIKGLSHVTCPVMVIGVKSDILFPVMQQQELADTLMDSGNIRIRLKPYHP